MSDIVTYIILPLVFFALLLGVDNNTDIADADSCGYNGMGEVRQTIINPKFNSITYVCSNGLGRAIINEENF